MIEQTHQKKAFIEVKHGDTQVKVASQNSVGDLAFFGIIAVVILGVAYIKMVKGGKK